MSHNLFDMPANFRFRKYRENPVDTALAYFKFWNWSYKIKTIALDMMPIENIGYSPEIGNFRVCMVMVHIS